MTERELCEWLGVDWPLPEGKRLASGLAEAMADVPAPGAVKEDGLTADGGHGRVFIAFLRSAGPNRMAVNLTEDC